MKKQFTNRILSLVLALMLIVGMMPITAFAAESGVTGELSYTLDDNGVLTISGSGAIGQNAFANRSDISSVIVSDGVTAIGHYAFRGCSILEKVTVLGEIEAIGNYAFANCTSLTTFEYWRTTVPNTARNVFLRTSLFEVLVTEDYEDDVLGGITVSKTLGDSSEPEKEKYTVTATATPANGGSISGVGDYEEDKEVTLTATANEGYVFVGWTKNGVQVSTNAKYTFTVTADCDLVAVFEEYNPYSGECGEQGDNALWNFDPATGVMTISGTGNMMYYRQGTAPWYSFKDQIKSVVIEDGITSVGAYTFYNCSQLADISISGSVTTIGGGAFSSCDSLTGVTIPEGVTLLAASAFTGCDNLKSVSLPSTLTKIMSYAFSSTALETITIPAGVTKIELYTFYHCKQLKTVNYQGLEDPVAWNNKNDPYALKVFDQCDTDNITVNVPAGYKDTTFCGMSVTPAHNHEWTYAVNANTITAICTADDCTVKDGGTLKLVVNDSYYTGNSVDAVVEGTLTNGATYKVTYNGLETAPSAAGTYIVKLTVYENGVEKQSISEEYSINKADQDAPTGIGKADETISAKNDGKITGVESSMEYRKDGESSYKDIEGTEVTDLADGTYFVRYKETDNYNASSETEVTIAVGRKLRVTLPQNQVGYTASTTAENLDWKDDVTITVEIHDGYSKMDGFKILVNGRDLTESHMLDGKTVSLSGVIADITIEIEGVADITAPDAEISIKDNKWNQFWNNITFGLFFKETQDVRITANDKGVGVDAIYYYLADSELELDEVKALTDWQEYNGAFQINPNNRYVIYAKAVDKNGNIAYINSAKGIVLDSIAPVLYGIENGGVYHGDKIFKAVDDNFLKVEVDGVDVTNTTEGDNEYKIVADNAEHTITVTDKAGNVTEFKITVYKRYMVTYTDGEGSSYEKEFNYGEVITIPTNEIFNDTFRRGGYTLIGWQGYTEGMTMPLNPVTLTALYKPNQYSVSFNANGGETIEPITVTFDEKYGNLPSSATAGLSGGSKNWYLVDAYGNVTEINIKNLTLVATARDHTLFIKRSVLAPNISITLAVPGGISDGYQYYIPGASQRVLTATVGNMNTEILDYAYKWYKDGALIEGATSNVLTLDGNVTDSGTYKVEVTATLKDGTNIIVTSDTATASKEQKVKILHATNTLSYDANGGEEGPQSSYTGGATLNVSKDVPTRMYYDFIGWNTAPDGSGDSYKADELYTFAEDKGNGGCVVTLYAQWKLVEYTVTYTADGQIIVTEKVEHGKDATLPAVPAKDGYVGKWDADGKNIAEDTTISVVYTEIPILKPDEVKPEDKTDLEDAKAKLEEELKDDSYTDEDKKDIQDAIDDIDDALEVIGNVEAVEELIDKLPDTIKKDDEAAIKAADDAYNALSDYEKSLVDEDAKKALDDAKAALAELNKPADTDSPQTGDNSNMFLWIALLFISGGAVITLTVVDRKKRMASNR